MLYWKLPLIGMLLCCTMATGCKSEKPSDQLTWHNKIELKSPIAKVIEVCGQPRCMLAHPILDSIEYGADASGRVKAILIRYKLPPNPSVQASRNIFTLAKEDLKSALGEGKTFLASGDPYYWPARDTKERVITITVDEEERTVIAIGVIGPGGEKIPQGGAAHDLKKVQSYWSKVAASLQDDKKKAP